jgi:hypothetical protein
MIIYFYTSKFFLLDKSKKIFMEKKYFKIFHYYLCQIFCELNCTNIWKEYDLKSDKI